MSKGTVKWFNGQKGFGFIKGEDNSDVFVHHSNLKMEGFRQLRKGDIVSYELGESRDDNRIQAINVQPILTLDIIKKSLKEEGLTVKSIRDNGRNPWIVVDESNIVQSREDGMDFEELAAYAGFSVEEGE